MARYRIINKHDGVNPFRAEVWRWWWPVWLELEWGNMRSDRWHFRTAEDAKAAIERHAAGVNDRLDIVFETSTEGLLAQKEPRT